MLMKPFTAKVDSNGHATLNIVHGLHGKQWVIYQTGFALGLAGTIPQVTALVNGQPLASTISLQPAVFGTLPGNPPYAVMGFMVGPPYVILKAGETMTCGVTGATAADTFTVAAYYDEFDSDLQVTMTGLIVNARP